MVAFLTEIVLPFILVLLYVLFWLVLSENFSRKNRIKKSDARKLLHIMVGNIIFFIPLFGDQFFLFLIPFSFIFVNFLLTPYGPIKKLRLETFESGHGFGTVWYAVSLTILVLIAYDQTWIILTSFFPLAYGDGLAAVIGSRANSGFLWSFGGKKSLIGTWTFIWASFFSVLCGLFIFNLFEVTNLTIEFILLISIIVSIAASFLEFISPKGMDNLIIPLGLLILIFFANNSIMIASVSLDLTVITVGFFVALFFGIIGFSIKFLTFDGALGGFFMGFIIMGIGGYSLGLALLIFFILGSLVTKLNKTEVLQSEFEKGSPRRDSLQAIAKAGTGTLIALSSIFFL